jgi:putative aldouronate transport system permease protein
MKYLESIVHRGRSPRGLSHSLLALRENVRSNYELYLFVLPAVAAVLVFNYVPMYGLQIAFKDFVPSKGIGGSEWVGIRHFLVFFRSYQFWDLLKNTLGLSALLLVVGFPLPIVLAILLNRVRRGRFRSFTQTVTYLPHFISVVVVVGMTVIFLSPGSGIVAHVFKAFGLEPVYFMGEPRWFKPVYVTSEVWMHTGWDSILYLAALASVDLQLYDAASIDGASKWQIIRFVELPSLRTLVVTLLLLRVGNLMTLWFEKVYLMQNDLNISSSEIIATYVYKIGLLSSQYSYSAAVGFFNVLVNFVLLVSVNRLAARHGEASLW